MFWKRKADKDRIDTIKPINFKTDFTLDIDSSIPDEELAQDLSNKIKDLFLSPDLKIGFRYITRDAEGVITDMDVYFIKG